MKVDLNPNVAEVALFMQQRFMASELVPLAHAISTLAPVLWGKRGGEAIGPIGFLSATLPVEQEPAASSPRVSRLDVDDGFAAGTDHPCCSNLHRRSSRTDKSPT
jgi:hypothetical protein